MAAQTDATCNGTIDAATPGNKEILSTSDSGVVDSDQYQENTNDTSSFENNATKTDTVTNAENGVPRKSTVSSQHSKITFVESYGSNTDSVLMITTNLDQVKNNQISDNLALQENTITADGIAKHNLTHQRCTSEDDSIQNDPKQLHVMKKRRQSISLTNPLYCKILIFFAVCSIVVCFLIPAIFYYVNQARESDETKTEYSHEINTSIAKIIFMEVCNFTDSDCVDQILYTYEALRTINLPSSQQYCSERVETLFCDALMECSNESYVKDIVCQQVRQEYCTAEWRMLEVHNQTDGLIDCEEYEETAPLNCSDQFDLANDGSVCLPLCGEFLQYSEEYSTFRPMLFIICQFISIIGGISVFTISYRKRAKMFQFPQVLVVINAGAVVTVNITIFISSVGFGRWNILCSKKFLFDALNNPTAFCTVQGLVISSALVLYSCLWLLYVFHLALKLFYPLKSAKLSNSVHRRAIVIAEILTMFLVSTLPSVVVAGVSDYKIRTFPPLFCGSDRAYRFYTTAIPILTSVCISLILMLLVIYRIHMHHGIFKRKHQGSVGKQVCTCQFTIPEVKIIFVLLYWLVLTILIWGTFSIRDGRIDTFNYHLQNYINCMAGGSRKDQDCQELRMSLEAESHPVVEVIYMMLIAFLNFASLPFVIQFHTMKHTVKRSVKQVTRRFSTFTTRLENNYK